MRRIDPTQPALQRQPLYSVQATRRIEQAAQAALPPHVLMQRAGLAVARLALALAPHARTIWIACGPGNNGGDGLEAAVHLQHWGKQPVVTWLGDEAAAPADALASLARARQAGVAFADEPLPGMTAKDLCIDALLGIGARRPAAGRLLECIHLLNAGPAPVLAIDVPSGLDADTGHAAVDLTAQNTLSLLTLKPGLFTARGRDAAGQVWLDPLDCDPAAAPACAELLGRPQFTPRAHASHKGSYGDVAVLGGAPGMTGAALLAASAALHGGAGRVFVALLDGGNLAVDKSHPELMFRHASTLDWRSMTVVCGCGGGDVVRSVLPKVLSTAGRLVLDADALNAVAADAALQTLLHARAARGQATVLTPHPLEAARLLGSNTAAVQADRLAAAQQLADRHGCVAVLKGSGTVIAAPARIPAINATGNARLATAGTGDVLAGLIGARLATGSAAFDAACEAVFAHGLAADEWPSGKPLVASRLACGIVTAGLARNP
ncbi:MAG TPA: NAD(P)H-hydrate dehydratase [Burkholderiaceae bacterium]|nr:NAD(P)H-hydrate dehydratase [Burkholderiaceae bacterium]